MYPVTPVTRMSRFGSSAAFAQIRSLEKTFTVGRLANQVSRAMNDEQDRPTASCIRNICASHPVPYGREYG